MCGSNLAHEMREREAFLNPKNNDKEYKIVERKRGRCLVNVWDRCAMVIFFHFHVDNIMVGWTSGPLSLYMSMWSLSGIGRKYNKVDFYVLESLHFSNALFFNNSLLYSSTLPIYHFSFCHTHQIPTLSQFSPLTSKQQVWIRWC